MELLSEKSVDNCELLKDLHEVALKHKVVITGLALDPKTGDRHAIMADWDPSMPGKRVLITAFEEAGIFLIKAAERYEDL